MDEHGNLIPKDGYEAGETYGKDVIPNVEPDAEIQAEYGLDEEPEIHRPYRSN
jgi:hypothetical protein